MKIKDGKLALLVFSILIAAGNTGLIVYGLIDNSIGAVSIILDALMALVMIGVAKNCLEKKTNK